MTIRALVTGASRGIGAAIAEALARNGHEVIVNFRTNGDRAAEVQQRIVDAGGRAVLAPFDVSDRAAVHSALDALLASGDPIGILVNNAGIIDDAVFPSLSEEAWHRVTRTTLDGFFNVTQPLVMPMVRRRWGRVISVSSVVAVMGNRGQTNYAAAKAGLLGATRSLAREVAKRGVTVNAVTPGLIETEMTRDVPVEQALKSIPMHRFGKPEEVADLVAFLASDAASYITGQAIGINGGMI